MTTKTIEQKKEGKDNRPPVIAVLGHIDHGKSTLIDYIRKTNVTGSEAGGITQHISAYEITHTSKDGQRKRITFIDTPGHEAFTSIRTRCTNIADIAVLIVSAEDGVKPQTLEVYKYIKECSLPYLVAITKVDKPSADIARTKQNLAENGIYVEGYGGNIPVIEISAVSGKGVDEFLDMIALMSELEGKTAEKDTLGSGVIIESRLDPKRGITAVGVIKNGTIRCGLFAASSGAVAPIRFFFDAEGNTVDELSFSSPIQIIGWDKMPNIGAEFKTFLKKDEAISFAKETEINSDVTKSEHKAKGEDMSYLPLIIKADTSGSLEVITNELEKLTRERIVPKILLSGVGSINENDIKSALATTGATIIGFNTKIDSQAAALAERSNITILSFNIIYELTDKIKVLLSEREPKVEVEEISGTAKILKIFSATKGKQVIGGRVLSGTLKQGNLVKIKRREIDIGQGKIKELQQSKIATNSVSEGVEFGTMIESKIDIAPGDVLNVVTVIRK